EALADFNKVIELDPKIEGAYINRGWIKSEQGHYAEAIEDYKKALKIKPINGETSLYYGEALSSLEKHEEAIPHFTRAITLVRGQFLPRAYEERAICFGYLGNFKRTLQDQNKVVALDPVAGAFYNRGVTYGRLAKHKEALEDYSKAIRMNPKYAS